VTGDLDAVGGKGRLGLVERLSAAVLRESGDGASFLGSATSSANTNGNIESRAGEEGEDVREGTLPRGVGANVSPQLDSFILMANHQTLVDWWYVWLFSWSRGAHGEYIVISDFLC
jgi:hypothetical protein